MTLYEIDNEIMNCIDEETGEIIDIDRLNALEMERDRKVGNVACWIKDLKAEAEAIKAEKQALDKRQKAAENKAERLKEWLSSILQGEKFKDSKVSISYRKSEKVVFAEDFAYVTLPDHMKKVTVEPRKTEIKEFLKAGGKIDGVKIEESSNMQIR